MSFNLSVINGGGRDRDGAHTVRVCADPPPEVTGAPVSVPAGARLVGVELSTAAEKITLNVCWAFGIMAYTVVPSGVSAVPVENGDSSSSVSFFV